MHMDMPELIYPSVQMPIFFFLSGTFFHAKSSFREQIINDGYRLLVPTVCFMAVVAILMTLRGDNLWSWNIIEVLQTCRNGSITWFLIALFCLRVLNYPFEKYRLKWWYLALATIVYPIGYLWKVKYPDLVVPIIPVVEIFMFGIYYVIGYVYGKKVLELSLADKARNVICYLFVGAYLLFVHCMDWQRGFLSHIPWLVYGIPYTLSCIFLGLVICRKLEKIELFAKPIAYIGKNSIVFYLTHLLIYLYIFKNLDWNPYLVFCIIVAMEFPLIYVITRYLPWMVGQRK